MLPVTKEVEVMEKKKRILLINHYAGSAEMGMEFRPYYLSKEWVKMGYHVDIIAADYSHLRTQNPKIEKDFEEEIIDGIHYHWIHTNLYEGNGVKRAITMAQFVSKLWFHAKRIVRELKPDVIITSSTYPLDTFAGQKIRKVSGKDIKLIHEVHDMWPLTLNEVGGMSKSNPFYVVMQIGENAAYKKSDCVVSLLPLAEEYMKEHGLENHKFIHIPNGVVEEEWNTPLPLPNEHFELLRYLKSKKKFIVGYFGGHAISNALDVLLDAAKISLKDDIAYVLVGDGVEKEQLIKRKDEENLENVYFLPKIPKQAVPNLVKEFDCSYVGAKNATLYRFGLCMNKIFDSMMAGKPIVCAITTPDTIITRHQCGIMVDSDNAQGIVEAVIKLMNMSLEERIEMGNNGRFSAEQNYSYKKLAEQFTQLF